MYLHTRPDVSFAFGVLSTVSRPSRAAPDAPTAVHRRGLGRTMRYLGASHLLGLRFSRDFGWATFIYKDASYARELHRGAKGTALSRSGYAFMIAGATVDSASLRQAATALSTAEAESNSLCLAVRRGLVIRRVISFMVRRSLPPTIVFEDNEAVIRQLKKRDLTSRNRHTRVNLGFVIDAVDAREIEVRWVGTQNEVGNTPTAAEDRVRFLRNRGILLGL